MGSIEDSFQVRLIVAMLQSVRQVLHHNDCTRFPGPSPDLAKAYSEYRSGIIEGLHQLDAPTALVAEISSGLPPVLPPSPRQESLTPDVERRNRNDFNHWIMTLLRSFFAFDESVAVGIIERKDYKAETFLGENGFRSSHELIDADRHWRQDQAWRRAIAPIVSTRSSDLDHVETQTSPQSTVDRSRELESILSHLPPKVRDHHKNAIRRWYRGETARQIEKSDDVGLSQSRISSLLSEWRRDYPELAPFIPNRQKTRQETRQVGT